MWCYHGNQYEAFNTQLAYWKYLCTELMSQYFLEKCSYEWSLNLVSSL